MNHTTSARPSTNSDTNEESKLIKPKNLQALNKVQSLLLTAATVVAMATELTGSSLAAKTQFRFPANLAEAFQAEGLSELNDAASEVSLSS